MRHFVVVGILIVILTVLTYVGLDAAGLMPVAASAQAGPIDWLWDLELMFISFLSALIIVPMAYSLIVFRRKKGDTEDAQHVEGNTNLEITWTVLPLFIVMLFAYLGAENLSAIRRVDPDAMVVEGAGIQWSWNTNILPMSDHYGAAHSGGKAGPFADDVERCDPLVLGA